MKQEQSSRLREIFGKGMVLNGHREKRLPNTINVSFVGFKGHEVLDHLKDTAASTGSACHSGATMMSPVFEAMGITENVGGGAVRFSLGRYTTKEEIDTVINNLSVFFY